MNDVSRTVRAPKRNGRMTQAERTALSDARMFESAKQIIVEKGTHNTTLKEIGERAGYSRGLASNRFGSKEALFSQMVRDFNRRWANEVDRFVDDKTGLAALIAALNAVESYLLKHSQDLRALYILWFETMSSHDELRQRLANNHMAYRHDVERWVREGIEEGTIRPSIDPHSFAVEFASLIFGLIYQWLVQPTAIDIYAVFKHYRRSTLELLSGKVGLNPGD
jgi:AcrR family transcriptional regulator